MKWQLSSIFYVFPLHKQLIFSFFNRQCFCQGDKMTQFATRHCKEPYTKECNLMHHGHLIKQKSQALKLTTHHWKSDLKQLFNYSFKVYHTLHFRYSSVSAYTKKKKKTGSRQRTRKPTILPSQLPEIQEKQKQSQEQRYFGEIVLFLDNKLDQAEN